MEQLQAILGREDVAAHFVGGCVRDLLLGRPLHDLDVVVAGDAVNLARAVARSFRAAFVLLDEENGVARVMLRGTEAGAGLTLDFARMRGGDLQTDLALRDLAINALAIPPADFAAALEDEPRQPAVIDPWGGLEDLRAGRLRAVGDRAFQDDPLRTLRVVRLAAELGFSIEEKTADLVRSAGGLLCSVSWERIRDELVRLLACPHAAPYLPLLGELELWACVFPEWGDALAEPGLEQLWERVCCLEWMAGVLRGAAEERVGRLWQPAALSAYPHLHFDLPHQGRLRRYLAERLSGERPLLVLLKLITLLYAARDGGRRQAERAARAARRLRLSGREALAVERAVAWLIETPALGELTSAQGVYRLYRDRRRIATGALLLWLADFLAATGNEVDPRTWERQVQDVRWIWNLRNERPEVIDPPRLIDGHELMQALSLNPGPRVGELLERVREAQAAGEVRTREEALLCAQRARKGSA